MRLLDKIIDVLYPRVPGQPDRDGIGVKLLVLALLGGAFTLLLISNGCDMWTSRPIVPAGVESRPHPEDPKWVAWRNQMAAFIDNARAGIDDLEKHGVDCAAKSLQARRAFNAIPADAEATSDPAETAKAGKRTALTSNARVAMEALVAVAAKVQAGDNVELGEELRDIRLILDGIENDPFFGK